MQTKVVLMLLGLLLLCPPAAAKKKPNPLKSISKLLKNKDADGALKQIAETEKDSTFTQFARLYNLGVEATLEAYKKENEKAYLRQTYDTTKLFNSILQAFRFAQRCDSVETAGGGPAESRQKNAKLLSRLYVNLGAGGKFFYRKAQYAEAETFIHTYLSLLQSPLVLERYRARAERTAPYFTFLGMQCNYILGRHAQVLAYESQMPPDTLHGNLINEMLARSALAIGDSANYRRLLDNGIRRYPQNNYYYTATVEWMFKRQMNRRVVALSDSLLSAWPNSPTFWFGKSLALINLKDYAGAISALKQVIKNDTTSTEPFYNIGLCFCSLAEEVALPTNIHSDAYRTASTLRQKFFKEALPYLEIYRKLKPDEKQRWAPLLYKVYLNLNMGPQFEEITRVLAT